MSKQSKDKIVSLLEAILEALAIGALIASVFFTKESQDQKKKGK